MASTEDKTEKDLSNTDEKSSRSNVDRTSQQGSRSENRNNTSRNDDRYRRRSRSRERRRSRERDDSREKRRSRERDDSRERRRSRERDDRRPRSNRGREDGRRPRDGGSDKRKPASTDQRSEGRDGSRDDTRDRFPVYPPRRRYDRSRSRSPIGPRDPKDYRAFGEQKTDPGPSRVSRSPSIERMQGRGGPWKKTRPGADAPIVPGEYDARSYLDRTHFDKILESINWTEKFGMAPTFDDFLDYKEIIQALPAEIVLPFQALYARGPSLEDYIVFLERRQSRNWMEMCGRRPQFEDYIVFAGHKGLPSWEGVVRVFGREPYFQEFMQYASLRFNKDWQAIGLRVPSFEDFMFYMIEIQSNDWKGIVGKIPTFTDYILYLDKMTKEEWQSVKPDFMSYVSFKCGLPPPTAAAAARKNAESPPRERRSRSRSGSRSRDRKPYNSRERRQRDDSRGRSKSPRRRSRSPPWKGRAHRSSSRSSSRSMSRERSRRASGSTDNNMSNRNRAQPRVGSRSPDRFRAGPGPMEHGAAAQGGKKSDDPLDILAFFKASSSKPSNEDLADLAVISSKPEEDQKKNEPSKKALPFATKPAQNKFDVKTQAIPAMKPSSARAKEQAKNPMEKELEQFLNTISNELVPNAAGQLGMPPQSAGSRLPNTSIPPPNVQSSSSGPYTSMSGPGLKPFSAAVSQGQHVRLQGQAPTGQTAAAGQMGAYGALLNQAQTLAQGFQGQGGRPPGMPPPNLNQPPPNLNQPPPMYRHPVTGQLVPYAQQAQSGHYQGQPPVPGTGPPYPGGQHFNAAVPGNQMNPNQMPPGMQTQMPGLGNQPIAAASQTPGYPGTAAPQIQGIQHQPTPSPDESAASRERTDSEKDDLNVKLVEKLIANQDKIINPSDNTLNSILQSIGLDLNRLKDVVNDAKTQPKKLTHEEELAKHGVKESASSFMGSGAAGSGMIPGLELLARERSPPTPEREPPKKEEPRRREESKREESKPVAGLALLMASYDEGDGKARGSGTRSRDRSHDRSPDRTRDRKRNRRSRFEDDDDERYESDRRYRDRDRSPSRYEKETRREKSREGRKSRWSPEKSESKKNAEAMSDDIIATLSQDVSKKLAKVKGLKNEAKEKPNERSTGSPVTGGGRIRVYDYQKSGKSKSANSAKFITIPAVKDDKVKAAFADDDDDEIFEMEDKPEVKLPEPPKAAAPMALGKINIKLEKDESAAMRALKKQEAEQPKAEEKPKPTITCEDCGKVFGTKSHLKRHRFDEHTVKTEVFRCYVCGHDALQERWLTFHLKYKHEMNEMPVSIAETKVNVAPFTALPYCDVCKYGTIEDGVMSRHRCGELPRYERGMLITENLSYAYNPAKKDILSQVTKPFLGTKSADDNLESHLEAELARLKGEIEEEPRKEQNKPAPQKEERGGHSSEIARLRAEIERIKSENEALDNNLALTKKRAQPQVEEQQKGEADMEMDSNEEDNEDDTSKCAKCSKRFQSQAELKRHEREVHQFKSTVYRCFHCGFDAVRFAIVQKHLKKHHDVEDVAPDDCRVPVDPYQTIPMCVLCKYSTLMFMGMAKHSCKELPKYDPDIMEKLSRENCKTIMMEVQKLMNRRKSEKITAETSLHFMRNRRDLSPVSSRKRSPDSKSRRSPSPKRMRDSGNGSKYRSPSPTKDKPRGKYRSPTPEQRPKYRSPSPSGAGKDVDLRGAGGSSDRGADIDMRVPLYDKLLAPIRGQVVAQEPVQPQFNNFTQGGQRKPDFFEGRWYQGRTEQRWRKEDDVPPEQLGGGDAKPAKARSQRSNSEEKESEAPKFYPKPFEPKKRVEIVKDSKVFEKTRTKYFRCKECGHDEQNFPRIVMHVENKHEGYGEVKYEEHMQEYPDGYNSIPKCAKCPFSSLTEENIIEHSCGAFKGPCVKVKPAAETKPAEEEKKESDPNSTTAVDNNAPQSESEDDSDIETDDDEGDDGTFMAGLGDDRTCPHCEMVLDNKSERKYHEYAMHEVKNKVYRCPITGHDFPKFSKLKEYLKAKHLGKFKKAATLLSVRPYTTIQTCPRCGFASLNDKKFRAHDCKTIMSGRVASVDQTKGGGGTTSESVKQCDKNFYTKLIEKHVFRCELCQNDQLTLTQLRRHCNVMHSGLKVSRAEVTVEPPVGSILKCCHDCTFCSVVEATFNAHVCADHREKSKDEPPTTPTENSSESQQQPAAINLPPGMFQQQPSNMMKGPPPGVAMGVPPPMSVAAAPGMPPQQMMPPQQQIMPQNQMIPGGFMPPAVRPGFNMGPRPGMGPLPQGNPGPGMVMGMPPRGPGMGMGMPPRGPGGPPMMMRPGMGMGPRPGMGMPPGGQWPPRPF